MANSLIVEEIKNKVFQLFVKNNEIVDTLDSPNKNDKGWNPIYLINNPNTVSKGFTPLLFNYHKNPEYIEDSITFINLMTHLQGKGTYVEVRLEIYIYSHDKHMRIDNPKILSNRNDYLSYLIDKELNGKDIGFGNLRLVSNNEGVFNKDFNFRKLTFITQDLNDDLCEY